MSEFRKRGTEGEQYVNELAFKSFFKYWCYPNPIDEEGNKKEICDLLICYDKIAIIAQVKTITFNFQKPQTVDKEISKGINHANGAERKLFKSDKQIHIKHPDREVELFDPNAFDNYYKIVIVICNAFKGDMSSLKPFKEKKDVPPLSQESLRNSCDD